MDNQATAHFFASSFHPMQGSPDVSEGLPTNNSLAETQTVATTSYGHGAGLQHAAGGRYSIVLEVWDALPPLDRAELAQRLFPEADFSLQLKYMHEVSCNLYERQSLDAEYHFDSQSACAFERGIAEGSLRGGYTNGVQQAQHAPRHHFNGESFKFNASFAQHATTSSGAAQDSMFPSELPAEGLTPKERQFLCGFHNELNCYEMFGSAREHDSHILTHLPPTHRCPRKGCKGVFPRGDSLLRHIRGRLVCLKKACLVLDPDSLKELPEEFKLLNETQQKEHLDVEVFTPLCKEHCKYEGESAMRVFSKRPNCTFSITLA